MTIPNLAGVIEKDDVFQKGSGNYAASYVSWARIANYLHDKAPGWEFHLKPAPDGGHVWRAPDGTGYVVSYFSGPDGEATADFLFPCQDHRNQPIPLEKVSCRVLTDTHRRALCANAAFAMSLGYELWAREEVQSAAAEQHQPPQPPQSANGNGRGKAAPAPKAPPKAKAEQPQGKPLSDDERKAVLADLQGYFASHGDQVDPVRLAFNEANGYPAEQKLSAGITTQAHAEWVFTRLAAAQ